MNNESPLTCARCDTAMRRTRRSLPQGSATCQECRRTVHGHVRYTKGCRCGMCRDGHREYMRYYRSSEPREVRRCDECGSEFEARKYRPTRFCSTACVASSQRKWEDRGARRNAGRRSQRRRQRFERLIAEAAAGTTGGKRVWVQGNCLVCSVPFMSPGLASRYCSPDCRKLARSSRGWISFEARRAIYERDNWNCQICSEPVNREADYLTDWAPTLDHIIPRSRGGSDEPENLRIAHRWCNSVRGDLSFHTDVDLRGVAA